MSDNTPKSLSVLSPQDFENAAQLGTAIVESKAQGRLMTGVDGHGTRGGNITAATTEIPTAVTRDDIANQERIAAFKAARKPSAER